MTDNQDPRLKALNELSALDQELGLDQFRWPENLEIDGLKFVCTSGACPEQYDVFDGERQVGYLRLRHGWFRVSCPDYSGETVHEAHPRGDGIFDDDERMAHLIEAVKKIRDWMSRQNAD
jgi:hypothetical protein